MERSVPDCLIRLIRDLEQGIISEAEFEPYEVRGAVCYAVEPSEPEGTFAEIREIEEWTDTDPVVKRRRREGDGVIRYRYSVRFSVGQQRLPGRVPGGPVPETGIPGGGGRADGETLGLGGGVSGFLGVQLRETGGLQPVCGVEAGGGRRGSVRHLRQEG